MSRPTTARPVAAALAALAVGRPAGWLSTLHIVDMHNVVSTPCMECGTHIGLGRVECSGCRTQYIVRNVQVSHDQVVFYTNENRVLVVEVLTPTRQYTPRKQTHSITYEHMECDQVLGSSVGDPNCVICHSPMVACLSVRVSKPVFTDEDVIKQHPLTKVVYTEVVSRPSARIGRAHRECAVAQESVQYGFRMVDLRVVPDKRQRSMGNRENDRLTDFRSFDQDYRVVNGEVVPFSPDSEDWE